ncbi:dihydrofolate reductase family protein [Cellulomonas sp. ACRRI]|uniref:dihydrofolate reductase family protein n=1 Tax=Cellulomonas sp. ACRRI TaxID=2918188 RepID=UPI001EF1AA8A|nr:dihydrofolate reductase family protein [Cellulomonas sp. ACRRI]MCG7284421.1 dihydrofolate reductase family protein [Cellulomonas sp. ACRRI]
MRLTTTTHVSLDGVLQGMGSADEDPRGGFTRGGWALGSGDPAVGDLVAAEYDDAAAFLLGRRTYEIFAGYWGTFPDPASHPVAAALHDRPRYVASRTLTHPAWPGTTVLAGDLAEAVGRLRSTGDGDLLVPGSGALVRWLLAHGLVDRMRLLVYPVVVGQGERLFPQDGPYLRLTLVSSTTTPGGVTVQTYEPAGRPASAGTGRHPDA